MIESTVSPAHRRAARVMVIGLDMGDGQLIRHWSQAGHLPNLASLIAKGAWLELESTAHVLHTSTWPTFATGSLPGTHGVYYPYQPKPGYQQAQHICPDQYGVKTFWWEANQQGCRCIVYDVPETFPESNFTGHGIFDWGTWAWYGEPSAQPETLIPTLKSKFGPYPLKMEAKRLGLKFPKPNVLEKGLLKSIEYKRTSLQWLMDQDQWDLTVVGFGETHPAGHYLWPKGARCVAETEEKLFQPMLRIYAALDRAIGSLCEQLASDVCLLITTGDGVRPNNCGWHLLPAALQRLGYTHVPAASPEEDDGDQRSASLLGRIKQALPPGTRRWIADRLPYRLRQRLGASLQPQIDWPKTRAFTLPTDLEGCIRINLKNREPNGIVEPGSEYTELCEEIRERLMEMTNPATGEPAVTKVWIRNDIFPGRLQEHLPDLVVSWNDSAPFAALVSPRFGEIKEPSPDPRTGTHSRSGFLLAHGPDILEQHQGTGHLIDVAPTVLNLLGLNLGPSMEGHPLPIMASGSHAKHAPAEPAAESKL